MSKQEIGVVIAQGLAETYRSQPKNPVDFLGKWLLHQTEVQGKKAEGDNRYETIQELIGHHNHKLKIQSVEEKDRQDELQKKEDKKQAFFKKVDEADDHEDLLQDLVDHIQEYTNSTSVYVAKLVQEKNEIEEDDDDTAHINEQAPLLLDIYHASPKGFEFVLRKTIKETEGVSHEVFKEDEPPADGQVPTPPEGEGEGDAAEKEPEVIKPQHFVIDEVVRDKRIKFFKVPRLGSLLCTRLKYESCLSEQALDEAVQDVYDVEARQRQQDIEKGIWEEQEHKRKEEAEKNEQEYEEEHKEWEMIKEKDFVTHTVNYAICCDTMGQDRKFTEAELDTTLNAIIHYSSKWEEQERRNLQKDVERKIEKNEEDKTWLERAKEKFENICERWVEQNLEETEEPKEDHVRNEERRLLKLEFRKKILNADKIEVRPESPPEPKKEDRRDRRSKRNQEKDESKEESKDAQEEEEVDYTEKWKNDILELKSYKVIKMKRVFQAVFYLLGYKREDICEENTNLLNWKKAKNFINDDFFKRIRDYNPVGPKDAEFLPYQKVNFIQKILEDVKREEVEQYSLALDQLLKFVQLAISLRKEDVLKRYFHIQKLKEEREQAIEQENERKAERDAHLEEERTKWEAEHQKPEKKEGEGEGEGDDKEAEGEGAEEEKFNEEEVLTKFDAEKEPVKIPDPVEDDIDNDIELTEEDMTQQPE